jgi:hypothetical protein
MAAHGDVAAENPDQVRPLLPERLPAMSPRGLAMFRLVWFLALAAALVAPVGGAGFRLAAPGGSSLFGIVRVAIDLAPPVFLIAAAILLYVRRRREIVAALLSLSFLLMAGGFFASEAFFRNVELTWLRDGLAHSGRFFLLLVLLTFPDGRFNPRWTLAVAALLAVWVPIALFRPLGLSGEYLVYLAFTAVAVLAIALPYRRLESGPERQQIRWALLGFAMGTLLLAAAVAVTFIPPGPDRSWAIAFAAQLLAALGIVSYALGLIVSLLRYRLYDADAAVSLSAGYAVLTLMLAGVFALSAKAIELLVLAGFGGDAGAVPNLAAAALAVVLVTPLNNRVQGWAERRFQKNLLHLRRDLPACIDDLRETATLPELLDDILARLVAGVRSARAAILIGGEVAAARQIDPSEVEAWARTEPLKAGVEKLDCDRADPLFPMRIPLRIRYGGDTLGEPLGWILLGPRPDGSFYGRDEREALAEVADPVARGVQIVLRREARERDQEARLAALERLIEGLVASPIRDANQNR